MTEFGPAGQGRCEIWTIGEQDLSIENLEAVARGGSVGISGASAWQQRLQASVDYLDRLWRSGAGVYGVTTGVGDSVTRPVPLDLVEEFPARLMAFHGVGLGRFFGPEEGRAIVAVRLANLARGYSGVRPEVVTLLAGLLERDLVPVIPEEGSVGASGDLTPLSYVAAVLTGERQVYWNGEMVPAREALTQAGLAPVLLKPKEALALMNGTAVMTALAARVWFRARHLTRLACRITALASAALRGNPAHFDPRLFELKPHPGTIEAATRIRADLGEPSGVHAGRLQDTYALRCAPHILGVLFDSLAWAKPWIETEINGVSDNPLLDPERPAPLHGGNFYGGHMALAMEALKNSVAQVADLLDRQIHLLLDEKTNRGLPANLTGSPLETRAVNHGLKALGIAASAWTAEALKVSLPVNVFSRSTESHNQDKVSLGTIAARDGIRVLELTEQVAAAALVTVFQALELQPGLQPVPAGDLQAAVRRAVPFVTEDRALDGELRQLLARFRELPAETAR